MTAKKRPVKKKAAAKRSAKYSQVEGRVSLETLDSVPDELKLQAYFFRSDGKSLGAVPVDPDGSFSHPVPLTKPGDVEVVIAPETDPEKVRRVAEIYSRKYAAAEWKLERGRYVLRPELEILELIWTPWWPRRICVSGHVRKTPGNCPVPFVKVEVFDVDRVFCLWPYIYPLRAELKRRDVVRVEDLIGGQLERKIHPIEFEPPVPPPPPDPRAIELAADNLEVASLGPQPEPPDLESGIESRISAERVQPEAVKNISAATFQSRTALWYLFPRCFYSKQLLCTTTTDENGYWQCCFNWWPLQYRYGWFRWDWRPDIIIKVTQVINGVETVLYLDPYSNTRWNVNTAHIDVWVDAPEIECGDGEPQDRPEGTQVFFTRIGNDEVYWINQANGHYEKGSNANVAYGAGLRIFAQFGDTLSRAQAIPGATAPYYYRLSYRKGGGGYTPISRQLKDTRVHKSTLFSESHTLGPTTVGSTPALYEVRDFKNYYWYNPDWIAHWVTGYRASNGVWTKAVPDGKYQLLLEIFDSTGTLLTNTKIDYRDGTVPPGNVLPALYPCLLVAAIDNERPTVNMTFTPAPTGCGVIQHSAVPPLTIRAEVDQANNRLRRWTLWYKKGITPGSPVLAWASSASGLATPVDQLVDAMSMLTGVTTTCAFAVTLWAESNVRNGYSFILERRLVNAIAVEKCPGRLVANQVLQQEGAVLLQSDLNE